MVISLKESSRDLRKVVIDFCENHLEKDPETGVRYVFGQRSESTASPTQERILLRILATLSLFVSLSILAGGSYDIQSEKVVVEGEKNSRNSLISATDNDDTQT